MRIFILSLFLIVVCGVSNVALAIPATPQDPPGEVATRFVDALLRGDYETAVGCVDESWVNSEIAGLGWPGPSSSIEERERFAREYGGQLFCGNSVSAPPVPSIPELWVEAQWTGIFPESGHWRNPPGWCGNEADRPEEIFIRNSTEVLVVAERVKGRGDVSVEIEVWRPTSFQRALFEISLVTSRFEPEWRVCKVKMKAESD